MKILVAGDVSWIAAAVAMPAVVCVCGVVGG